jgi:phosphate transport system substrate-binding protein
MDDQHSLSGSGARRKNRGGVTTRILVMLFFGAAVGLAIFFAPRLFSGPNRPASERPQLKTGGTEAIVVVAENFWKGKYAKDRGVDLVCDSVGTTHGVNGMLDKTYAVAFTHAPVSAELREKAQKEKIEVVHIPLMLCGVVPAYHVEALKGKTLHFSGAVLAGIFLGKIKHWDDPALKAINPGVDLPATEITVVHRDDSSGTTHLFTEYLAAVSPAWAETVGPPAAVVKWPVGVGAARNQGVAGKIQDTDGAIGYVDRLFTSFQDIALDWGAVQNKDQSAFVPAEPKNFTAAARAVLAEIPADLTFSLIDKPGKDSYPITGVIYAVCADRQSPAAQKQIVDFLRWATHEGQAEVGKTPFAALPAELVERVDRRLEAIKAAP